MVQKIFMTLTLMLACLSCFLPAVWADPGVSAQSAIVLEKECGKTDANGQHHQNYDRNRGAGTG